MLTSKTLTMTIKKKNVLNQAPVQPIDPLLKTQFLKGLLVTLQLDPRGFFESCQDETQRWLRVCRWIETVGNVTSLPKKSFGKPNWGF